MWEARRSGTVGGTWRKTPLQRVALGCSPRQSNCLSGATPRQSASSVQATRGKAPLTAAACRGCACNSLRLCRGTGTLQWKTASLSSVDLQILRVQGCRSGSARAACDDASVKRVPHGRPANVRAKVRKVGAVAAGPGQGNHVLQEGGGRADDAAGTLARFKLMHGARGRRNAAARGMLDRQEERKSVKTETGLRHHLLVRKLGTDPVVI